MVLYDLLIKLFSLMYLLHELLDARLVLQVSLALPLLKACLLVSHLHKHALVLGSLLLDRAVQAVIFTLDAADLFVGKVDRAKYIRLRLLRLTT